MTLTKCVKHPISILTTAQDLSKVIVAVLAQMAEIERNRIKDRCDAGRVAARVALAATGRTHRGKASLGRPRVPEGANVASWRAACCKREN